MGVSSKEKGKPGSNHRFEVKTVNICDSVEVWSWDTLEELIHDYTEADVLALPNDFDRVVWAYMDGKKIDVDEFGLYVHYVKRHTKWKNMPEPKRDELLHKYYDVTYEDEYTGED